MVWSVKVVPKCRSQYCKLVTGQSMAAAAYANEACSFKEAWLNFATGDCNILREYEFLTRKLSFPTKPPWSTDIHLVALGINVKTVCGSFIDSKGTIIGCNMQTAL